MKSNIRGAIFDFLDFIKGNPILKSIEEVKLLNECNDNTLIIKHHKNQIKKLIRSVNQNIPFYNKLKHINFEDFPVINKNIILNNYNSFYNKDFMDKGKKISTSGSTGIPFNAYLSYEKIVRNRADNIYFMKKINFIPGQRIYFFRVWNDVNKLSYLEQKKNNIIPINVSKLNHHNVIKLLNNIEKDSSNKIFLGYASSIETFFHLIPKQRKKFNGELNGIVTMAEGLSEHINKKLSIFLIVLLWKGILTLKTD